MPIKEFNDFKVSYNDDIETKEKLFKYLLNYFIEQKHFCGESLCQSDSTYETCAEVFSTIAEDIFKFKQEWKD